MSGPGVNRRGMGAGGDGGYPEWALETLRHKE